MQTLILLLSTVIHFSYAATIPFESHPTAPGTTLATCAPVDFRSNFRVQNAEKNIRSLQSDFSKPNFNGAYLLLKNEMMMETKWYIVDCKTGKFLKPSLNGELQFKIDSAVVGVFDRKNKTEMTELQLWSEGDWLKLDMPVETPVAQPNGSAQPTATKPVAALTIQERYEKLFEEYNVTAPALTACKAIQWDSNFRLERSKESILKLNPGIAAGTLKPNFGGRYHLVKAELLFETNWFVMDCETGKVVGDPLYDQAKFKPNSRLVIQSESGKSQSLWLFLDQEKGNEAWVQLPDPIQPEKKPWTNLVVKGRGRSWLNALPNPKKLSTLRFEKIHCNFETKLCTVVVDKKNTETLNEAQSKALIELAMQWKPANTSPGASPTSSDWNFAGTFFDGSCKDFKETVECRWKWRE